jgi:hypothetical protein
VSDYLFRYTTAVATGHIQPLCPLISITGAFPPESGILSIALIVIAPLLLAMVHIRYKHMKGFHLSQKAHFVNVITLICAAVAATGTVGVASFKPLYPTGKPHIFSSLLVFCGSLGLSVTMTTLTIITYRKHNHGSCGRIFAQVFLTTTAAIFLVTGIVLVALKPKGSNVHFRSIPVSLRCGGAVCEWGAMAAFCLFLLTFHEELRQLKVTLTVTPKYPSPSNEYSSIQ